MSGHDFTISQNKTSMVDKQTNMGERGASVNLIRNPIWTGTYRCSLIGFTPELIIESTRWTTKKPWPS